jgi:hypothetical protein
MPVLLVLIPSSVVSARLSATLGKVLLRLGGLKSHDGTQRLEDVVQHSIDRVRAGRGRSQASVDEKSYVLRGAVAMVMTAQETIQLMTSRGEKSPRLRAAKSGKLPSEGSPASKTPRSEGLVRAGLPSGNGGLVERADERGHAGDVELCKSSVDRSGRPHVVCDAEPDGGARPAGEHGKGEHSGERLLQSARI